MMWFIAPGLAISAFGWAYLLFGVSVEANSSLFARPDVMAHTLAIVSNVINFGYALCIFGAVWDAGRGVPWPFSLIGAIGRAPEATAKNAAASKAAARNKVSQTTQQSAPDQDTEDTPTGAVDWSQVEAEFLKTFGVQARINNGRVMLKNGNVRLEFETVEVAWDYCLTHFYDPKRNAGA